MSNTWRSNEFAKIHAGCGGIVRWVEAYDDPFTGYTGECIDCRTERIVLEDIIPIRCDRGEIGIEMVEDVDMAMLSNLEWDDTAEWEDNQRRLREEIDA